MINSFNTRFIEHSSLKPELLNEIINLKSEHWAYPYEEHKRWLYDNFKAGDLHVIIEDENHNLLAYCSLAQLDLELDGVLTPHWGLGSVCVRKEHLKIGLGRQLIITCNFYISQTKIPGILLCTEDLRKMYKKFGWHFFEKKFYIADKLYESPVMFSHKTNAEIIKVDSSF